MPNRKNQDDEIIPASVHDDDDDMYQDDSRGPDDIPPLIEPFIERVKNRRLYFIILVVIAVASLIIGGQYLLGYYEQVRLKLDFSDEVAMALDKTARRQATQIEILQNALEAQSLRLDDALADYNSSRAGTLPPIEISSADSGIPTSTSLSDQGDLSKGDVSKDTPTIPIIEMPMLSPESPGLTESGIEPRVRIPDIESPRADRAGGALALLAIRIATGVGFEPELEHARHFLAISEYNTLLPHATHGIATEATLIKMLALAAGDLNDRRTPPETAETTIGTWFKRLGASFIDVRYLPNPDLKHRIDKARTFLYGGDIAGARAELFTVNMPAFRAWRDAATGFIETIEIRERIFETLTHLYLREVSTQ